ncbi:MAG: O-antigen ligase family protein [Pseudomonadota bacterium]
MVIIPLMGAGYVLRPKVYPDPSELRLTIAWLSCTAVVFTFQPGPILFILMIVAILFALPRSATSWVPYLILLLIVIPAETKWSVPFPGVNYLFNVNSTIVILSVAGIAGLMRSEPKDEFQYQDNNVGKAYWLFVVFTLLLGMRAPESFTNEIRSFIFYYLETGVLFALAARGLSRSESHKRFTQFLVLGCCFIAAAGLFSALKGWDFYGHLQQGRFGLASRGGVSRIGGQFAETLLGVLMCTLAYTVFVYRKKVGLIVTAGWAAVAMLVLVATDSRAAVLAVILTGGAHFVLFKKSASAQWSWGLLGVIVAVTGVVVISNLGFDQIDEYGTFDYRSRLIETSIEKVRMAPIFGDPNYATHPMFEPLRQGQGIIDFVNVYVQVVLEFGLAGLLIVLVIPIMAIFKVMGRANALAELDDERSAEYSVYGRWLCVLLSVHMVTMATISAVSYVFEYFIILCAACQGFLWMVERHLAQLNDAPAPVEAPEPQPRLPDEDEQVFDPFGQGVYVARQDLST